METASLPLSLRPPAAPRAGTRWFAPVARVLGPLALLGLVAGSAAIVVAAAQGNSFYSPINHRVLPSWVAGPFAGTWPARPDSVAWLQTALLIALGAMFLCYAVALACARQLSPALVWSAVVAVHVVFVLSPPLLLTDVFNYLNYARLGVVHDLNPYVALPLAAPSDPAFPLSNWHSLRSPYEPLFTLGTDALVPLGLKTAYWSFKVAVGLASLGCLALVWRIARQLDRPALRAVVLVGLNPMVLVFGLGGQHNDVFMMLGVLAALTLLMSGRAFASGFSMVAAVAMKASAAALAPPLVLGSRSRRSSVGGAVAGALVLGITSYVVFGAHLPALGDQARLVSPFSIPNLLGLALGRGGEDAALRTDLQAVLIAAVAAASLWAWLRRDALTPCAWVTLVLLVTLGWDMPWYVLWLLPFIAFVRSPGFRIAAVIVCVYMTVQWLPLTPHWAYQIGLKPDATAVGRANEAFRGRLLKGAPKRRRDRSDRSVRMRAAGLAPSARRRAERSAAAARRGRVAGEWGFSWRLGP